MSWQHLRDTTPKGRKDYRCFLCGRAIPKGEQHVQRVSIGDGGLDTIRMHVKCEAISQSWDQADWECFSEGDLNPDAE